MNSYQPFIGIDRSDAKIDIAELTPKNRHLQLHSLSSSPEALQTWVDRLAKEDARVAICVEQPCANLTGFLVQFDFIDLYLINPAALKRYRESYVVSGAKDDTQDSRWIAQFIAERHDKLKPWRPADLITRKLRHYTEHRRSLVDERTQLSNQLKALLKDYFPQALQVTADDLYAKMSCNFLLKWPTLQALKRAKPSTITQFYHLHNSVRPERNAARLALIEKAVPLTGDEAILSTHSLMAKALAKQLLNLCHAIASFDQMIEKTVAQHADYAVFSSFPGAGSNFAARLIAGVGSDRSVYESATGLQRQSGIAPVQKQSGKMCRVQRRYARPKFLHQTFIEWAGLTIPKSIWAKAYYRQQRENGKGHFTALRALAFKWQRIVYRCWQSRTAYDEEMYLKALRRSNSPLVAKIDELIEAAKTS
ncbi:MAG: IS110 family transposase [Verrucomicrobiota bacterium]